MTLMPNRQVIDGEDLIPVQDETAGRFRLAELVITLRETLRRRFLMLFGISFAIFAVAFWQIMQITPRYEATARLRIDPTRTPGTPVQDATSGLSDEAIETQVATIASPEIARTVVEKLKLTDDPEFGVKTHAAVAGGRDAELNMVAGKVVSNLHVGREKLTYVINIVFQSRDPVTAARVANAFAGSFIDAQIGGRTSTAANEAGGYTRQLDQIAEEVRTAEGRLAQYRASAGIVEGGANGTITDQQVGPISSQLAQAESDAAESRAKLAQAQRQISAGGLDAVSLVRSSPVIGDLRRQLAEVTRNLADVTARYGERYPETIKVRQQIDDLNRQIKDEANRAIGSLRADSDAASARAASLASSMRELKNQQATNTRASVTADGLQRDAANKRAAYDRLAQMRLEALQSARNNIANVVLTDIAQVPTTPTAPNKKLLLIMALAVALGAGIAVIAAQELLTSGLRSLNDVERRLRLSVLASIPRISKGRAKISPADQLITQPASFYAEALRNARASILGVGTEKPPQVIAFTSALPEEGKTTTALSFSRLLAMNGTKTLLIDCDLRKAGVQSIIGSDVKVGLVEVLRGQCTASEAIIKDEVPSLDLLLVPEKLFSAEEFFAGEAMTKLLTNLRRSYDVIILDLPPAMGFADARILSHLADGVAFILRWNSTPGRAAATAISWLRGDNANILGVIFTVVDRHAEAAGGLFYSGKYASYYQST